MAVSPKHPSLTGNSSVVTPVQIASARLAAAAIADPQARLAALEQVQNEALQAQGQAAVAAPGYEDIDSKDYNALLGAMGTDISTTRSAINKATTTPSRTPAQNEADQAAADKAKAENAERAANQARGLGYITDAEAHAQANQDAAQNLDAIRVQLQAKLNDANISQAERQQALDEAKEQAAEVMNAATIKSQQAQLGETQRANTLNAANNFVQNEVSQANNRAGNAASLFNNAGSTALDVAKGGGTPAQIGSVLGGLLGLAPSFQSQMGGGSVGFGADDFKKVLAMVNSGAVPPDANGNVVPNAIKAVAAGQQPITAPPAGYSAGNPAVGGTMGPNGFQPGAGGNGSNLVTFAAPAA